MNEITTTPPLNVKIAGMPAWIKSYPLNVVYKLSKSRREIAFVHWNWNEGGIQVQKREYHLKDKYL